MNRSSRPTGTPAKLSDSINGLLNRYALAAGAAGVGMLALAPPVEAKIVYTPAHEKFPVTLDLNHDGIGDFVLALGGRVETGFRSQYAWVYAPRSNNKDEIVATAKRGYAPAVALRAGERIGPGRLFGGADILVAHATNYGRHSSSTLWEDQWANGGKGLKDRYLGLKFMISGQVHFGWARVTVTTSGKTFTATLTGYAYETVPNKCIIAGKTKGPDEIDNTIGQTNPAALTPPPRAVATLGLLAMGSPGLSIWRREESAEPAQ